MFKLNTFLALGALLFSLSSTAAVNFEIANRHNKAMWVTVQEFTAKDPVAAKRIAAQAGKDPWSYHSKNVLHRAKLEPGKMLTASITNPANDVRVLLGFNENITDTDHSYRYVLSKMKSDTTMFISFNPEKSGDCKDYVYPQTGTVLSLRSKTNSGFSLAKNLTNDNITSEMCLRIGK